MSEIPAQHRDKAHALLASIADELFASANETEADLIVSAKIDALADLLDRSAATARAEGRAEAAQAVRNVLALHCTAKDCRCTAHECLEAITRLGTVPQVGTGSEYERGRADGRRLTLEAAQLALVASGFDAFGPLYRRIEDRAELPTDAPTGEGGKP